MRLVRVLFGCLILGALAWTGWWYAVALGQEKALEAWFADRAKAGWQAEHGEIELTGFPLRLERRIPEIRLADPEAGWAWAAPFLEIGSGPVNPTHFEVDWPGTQNFAVPGESVEIASDAMGARLAVRPETALRLVEASVETAGLGISARSGWDAAAAAVEARVAARVNDAGYEVALRAERVTMPRPLMARIDPLGMAGRELDRLVVEGAAVFTRPLDREVVEEGRIGLVAADIRRADLQWGEIRLAVEGDIRVDEDGYPEGELDVTARHWREIVKMARRSGAIGGDMADAIMSALELVAMLGGDSERLDATLTLEDGRVWLGPVALGDAPRLAAPRG